MSPVSEPPATAAADRAAAVVRPMTSQDIPAVAAVRVLGWQSAYVGLVPQSYLDAMSQERELATRTRQFEKARPGVVNLVAERAGEVVGWSCWGPYREAEGVTAGPSAAELYTLYVHPDRLSTGAGRVLMSEAARQARAAGFASMHAWVLRGNARALRFYRKAGFAVDPGEESFELDGITLYEVRCSRRLSEAAAAAPSLG
ncbi:GNAT family N-acetyltransferase [Streptomyces sp. NPDC004111]|uniref:GNAT family N-acetyltransferase n=1 Tax=Streptomyces sp. NPDC004111 TaxID=3364690 RepID=UPI0036BF7622